MKIENLIKAIGVSVMALFELCFTGRADRAWRFARSDDSLHKLGAGESNHFFRESAPAPLLLMLLTIVFISIISNQSSIINAYQVGSFVLEDGLHGMELPDGSVKSAEPPSSDLTGPKAVVAAAGCIVFSIIVVAFYIHLSSKKPERNLDK